MHTDTDTGTDTGTDTDTQTHTHTLARTHAHAHAHTHPGIHSPTHPHTLTPPDSTLRSLLRSSSLAGTAPIWSTSSNRCRCLMRMTMRFVSPAARLLGFATCRDAMFAGFPASGIW
eukprot:6213266-Pleurochrysis_carterae.AAC.2